MMWIVHSVQEDKVKLNIALSYNYILQKKNIILPKNEVLTLSAFVKGPNPDEYIFNDCTTSSEAVDRNNSDTFGFQR